MNELKGKHGCKTEDTRHPVPNLCLINKSEVDAWLGTPGRATLAVAIATAVIARVDGFTDGDAPTINRPAINS